MAKTRTISSDAIRSYKLPLRTGPDGSTYGARLRLRPGETITVPAWYFAALLEEPGWRKRMNAETGIVRGMKGGPGGHFEAAIKMRREARTKAEQQELLRNADARASDLEKRLATLEADAQRQAARNAELEDELAKVKASKADAQRQAARDEPKADAGDTKLDPKADKPRK